ncbi:MAG: response regulator [Nitrospinota bacterium]|nr:response regulator [Nitrospinota bacterium]
MVTMVVKDNQTLVKFDTLRTLTFMDGFLVKKAFDDILNASNKGEIIIDLENIEFIDSFGVGVIIISYKKLSMANRALSFMNVNMNVGDYFHRLSLHRLFRINGKSNNSVGARDGMKFNETMKPVCKFHDAYFIGYGIVEEFRQLAEAKGITLLNDIPKNTRIYGDRMLMCQVISNIVSNAIKFCSKNDVISLYSPEDRPSTISVADTGRGIEREKLEKLFEYGSRKNTFGTAGEAGAGVGLPLCMEIVKAHGGNLIAESVEGKGSTFHIELPQRIPKVLLIDDDYDMRFVHGVSLMCSGVEVMEARDGNEAIEILENATPDLIITDLRMPGMDGMKLISILRKNSTLKQIPIIVVTAQKDVETRAIAMQSGADDFIIKPIIAEDFSSRIKKYIG